MGSYESIVITDASLESEATLAEINKIKTELERYQGKVVKEHSWGRRRLAYAINNITHGNYTILYVQADPKALEELERHYRLSENILKYQTIKTSNIEQSYSSFIKMISPKKEEIEEIEEGEEDEEYAPESANAN